MSSLSECWLWLWKDLSAVAIRVSTRTYTTRLPTCPIAREPHDAQAMNVSGHILVSSAPGEAPSFLPMSPLPDSEGSAPSQDGLRWPWAFYRLVTCITMRSLLELHGATYSERNCKYSGLLHAYAFELLVPCRQISDARNEDASPSSYAFLYSDTVAANAFTGPS